MANAAAESMKPPPAAQDLREEALAWIDALLRRTGRNLTELASAAGLAQTTLTEARRGTRPLTARTLTALADAFHTPAPAELLAALPAGRERGRASMAAARKTASRFVLQPEAPPLGRRVQLLATPRDIAAPFFRINFLAVTDTAPRPAGIADAKHVFALRMPDDGMAPWRRQGELLYVDPVRPVAPGRHVLLRMMPRADPNGMEAFTVALFEDMRGPGGTARYHRYDHPAAPLSLATWRVSQAHCCLEIGELLGS